MLCEIWGWRGSDGKTKDMSCRDLLLALDKTGRITLPKLKTTPRRAGDHIGIKYLSHDETPIVGSLKDLQPLRVEVVLSNGDLAQFKSYINQYHYPLNIIPEGLSPFLMQFEIITAQGYQSYLVV